MQAKATRGQPALLLSGKSGKLPTAKGAECRRNAGFFDIFESITNIVTIYVAVFYVSSKTGTAHA